MLVMEGSAKDVGLILDGVPEFGPMIAGSVQVRVHGEVARIPLVRRPPSQLDRRDQPALLEARVAPAIPVLERAHEVVCRHERIATDMEADSVVPQAGGRFP